MPGTKGLPIVQAVIPNQVNVGHYHGGHVPEHSTKANLPPSDTDLVYTEQCSFGNRLFHRVQEFADVVGCQRRVDENMGMFRHDDVNPEVICMQLSGTIQSIEHPVTTTILAQKRSSLKTPKR